MSAKKLLKHLTIMLLKIGLFSSVFAFLYHIFYIADTYTGRGAVFAYKAELLLFIFIFYFVSKILFSLGVYLTLIPTIRKHILLRLIVFFAVPLYFLIDFSTRSKNIFMKGGVVHIFYMLVLVYYHWRFCLFLKRSNAESAHNEISSYT